MFQCICVCMFASTLDGRYQTVGDIQCPFYLSTVSRAVGLRVFSIRRTFNKRIGISGTNIPTWLAEPHCSSVSWAQGGQHRIVALPVFLLARFIHVVLVGDFMALQAGFPGMPNSLPNRLMFISRKIAGMVKWGFSMELFFQSFWHSKILENQVTNLQTDSPGVKEPLHTKVRKVVRIALRPCKNPTLWSCPWCMGDISGGYTRQCVVERPCIACEP